MRYIIMAMGLLYPGKVMTDTMMRVKGKVEEEGSGVLASSFFLVLGIDRYGSILFYQWDENLSGGCNNER